jgi:hypothetical protein
MSPIFSHGVYRAVPALHDQFDVFRGTAKQYVQAMGDYLDTVPEQDDVSLICHALLDLLVVASTLQLKDIALQIISESSALGYTCAFLDSGLVPCLLAFVQMETDPVPVYWALVTLNAFAVGCRCRVSCLSRRPNAALSKPTFEAVKLLRARFRKSKRLAVATDKYFALYSVTQDEAKAAQQADAMAALLIFQEDARKRPRITTTKKKRTVKQLKKKQVEPATAVETAHLPSQLSFTFEPNAVVDCLSALGIDLSIDDLEYLTRHTKDCDSNQEMHGRTVICTYAQQSFW